MLPRLIVFCSFILCSHVEVIRQTSTLAAGVYTIQQKSTNRYVDAHEKSSKDYSLVTRSAQNNSSQQWILKPACLEK